jgi:NADH dehydrogenase FAD-containing subunit
MKDDWATDAYFMHKNAMKIALRNGNVKIQVSAKAVEVNADGLVCETAEGKVTFPADSILLAAGMRRDNAVAESFYNAAPRVFEIGDCVKPGQVVSAVTNGYYRALDI